MGEIMHKTKEQNTFRFKSFASRVDEIDLRRLALYHIGHENEQLEELENETFFCQTLKKWTVLNLTEEFNAFSRKCQRIVTLPQLIHQKDVVIDALLERLSTASNLSLQPLLELLYVLARDLRVEFYPYFQRVLDRLVNLLNTQDAEQLEWTFVCLAHLFKALKPYLRQNIGVVFNSILPLLDEQRYEEHVTNFAVECFSFIAREVPDYKRFLDFVLETVAREQVQAVQGCGRLLFEIMRGVKGQFHSTAARFLGFIFDSLINEDISQEKCLLLGDIVDYALQQLLKFIHTTNMSTFWLELCAVAGKLKNAKQIERLMPLFLRAASYRNGKHLMEMDVVVPAILDMIDKCMKAKESALLRELSSLNSKIVMSGSTQLTQLDTSRLIKKMLTTTERDIYAEFVLQVVAHPQFEFLVLPAVVAQFESHFDLPAFELMARIVSEKQPMVRNAIQLPNWKAYDIHLKNPQTLQKLHNKFELVQGLKDFNVQLDATQELLLLYILAPHIKALRAAEIESRLKACMELVCQQQQGTKDFLQIFAVLFETALHLGFKFELVETEKFQQALLPFVTDLQALNCLDLLLASNIEHFKSQRTMLSTHLSPLLSSHQREIRMIAAHCLKTLYKVTAKCVTPYDCIFAASAIAPNLQNYREQLLQLQKLDTAGELFKALREQHFKLDVLRFLLGLLYENFKFVWEPTLQLIEDYAKCLPVNDFWLIYKAQLDQTAAAIAELYKVEKNTNEGGDNIKQRSTETSSFQFLNSNMEQFENCKLTQQELMNYRNLLWQRLPKLGTVAEQKNRELVALFFDFLHNEYRGQLQKREHTWDLLAAKQANKNASESIDEEIEAAASSDEEDDDDDDDVDDKQNSNKKHKSKRRRHHTKGNPLPKLLLQTLQIKLGIFSVQPNPKAMYREPELHALYMELLAGTNPFLQKQALDCVFAYKNKHLLALKEHLYAFNDELQFKNELINFKLDTLSEEQRAALMPILLRLLYGKMLTRGTQRALSAQARKSLILRFLAQCTTTEIYEFLQMSFGRYAKYTDKSIQDLTDIPKLVQSDFQLTAAPSAKKLKSIVNLLELVRKEFGGIMGEEFHVYMLKLLVYVGSSCQAVLDAIDELSKTPNTTPTTIHPKICFVYRKVKQATLLSLVNFFAHIDSFDWQHSQISCFTAVFVWPNIGKLQLECLQSPTALLKLILEWGQQPRLFKYLNQKQPGTQLVLFHYIIELLLNERAKSPVQKPLMSLVERLLVSGSNADPNEADDEIPKISLEIVKPFIPNILQRLKQSFKVGKKQKNKLRVDKQQLNILSLLTTYVEDSETCENLLELMLPVLIAKSQASANDETLISQVITTLKNLIKRLNAPETQLLKIAPLFEFVQDVASRKLLCELVVDIASKRLKQAKKAHAAVPNELCERLKEITRITLMLNAWDKRWVEQPDYDKRLDALKQVTQKLAQGSVDLDLGVLVIYNCCYYLRYDKDMGLRDNASEHLRLLLPKLTQHLANEPKQLHFLVNDIFLNLARRLISDINDNIRNEGIRLLGAMARQCGDAHVILKDLAPLTDRHDEEADFFENLTHLQAHRHGRALLKFCTHAGTLTIAPATRTLTEFVLPLATRYLLQEKHTGKHTLIDAAIEALGVACQLLPWQQYHAILRYYLQKMRRSHDYQKQCVRIVVRILDAFHFDLATAQNGQELAEQMIQQAKKEIENRAAQEVKVEAEPTAAEEDNEADDDLEAALDEAASDEEVDETSVDPNDAKLAAVVPLLTKATPLSFSASKRILTTINTILIPTLNRAITERTHYDTQHKINRRRIGFEREAEEILRVPIALALVKLMQKLPKQLMENGLPGVFMKVCTFLRSPLKSVRLLTREILKKIMLTLGSNYLPLLVEHLQSLLTRGFQVHVLTVTIHGVLDALRGQFQAKDIDNCLGNLLEVALNDIFGDPAAEKEVQKIASQTPEAKPSAKSYLVLHIAARNIQESSLLDLLMPFKEHLARSHSRKLILKIQECFAKIVSGLVENPHISRESLLVFIYGMISESITDLLPGTQKRQLSEQEKEKMRRARPDCYIIAPTPQRRMGAVNKNVKSNAQANAHILIEFGLELLHIIVKRKKLADLDHQAFLNPLLPLLTDALKSTYIRVTTFTLKCFAAIWNNEYELPELDEHLPVITTRMFEILKNLSTFGASKQEDNIQLIKSTLKALVALLRQCPQYTITPEQIDQLVLHIEQDLYEGDKQPLSFALLKALIARRVDSPSVHGILKQIAELSITSQSDYVRDECRQLLLTYVMEYTLHKRVDQLIKNFAVQLCYTVPSGRMSAIQFMAAVIKRFPQQILSKRAEFLFLSLGTRLVNDDDSSCRKAVAECIESLLMRLEKADRHRLFEITALFFEEAQKPSVREMAASFCSRYLNVEKRAFMARLPTVLPVIVARLAMNDPRTPGKFVRAPTALGAEVDEEQIKARQMKLKRKGKLRPEIAEQDSEEAVAAAVARKQRAIDHEIIQMQYCMHKMLDNCLEDIVKLNDETLISHIDELAYTSQRLLAHEHAWVRSNAAKTISQILAQLNLTLISKRLCGEVVVDVDTEGVAQYLNFMHADPANDIKSLVLDLCAQLVPGDTPQAMIDEMAKIFLLIANMLRNVPFEIEKKESEDDSETSNINLKWLMGRIRFLINKEMAKAPHCVSMRTALFNLIEGLITIMPADALAKLAPMVLLVLVREMSEEDQQIDADLRQLALHVGSRLRKALGSDVYDKLRTRSQTALLMRRAERKKIVAQEKIHDPVKAAKRKVATQERKKAAKKRKTDVMRGKVEDVKQKLKKRKRKAERDELF